MFVKVNTFKINRFPTAQLFVILPWHNFWYKNKNATCLLCVLNINVCPRLFHEVSVSIAF